MARHSVRHMACSFSEVGRKEGQTMKAQTVHMTDKMLRDAVIAQLDFEPEVDPAGIGVAAEVGVVTLSGFVDDYAQKVAAENALQCIRGVKAVANLIEVAPAVSPVDIQKKTDDALHRSAEDDARQIKVTTRDQVAVLSGNARSLSEGEEAERAAWSVAGVVRVGDLIVVEPGVTG